MSLFLRLFLRCMPVGFSAFGIAPQDIDGLDDEDETDEDDDDSDDPFEEEPFDC
jgi:hypothetical protein